VVELAEGLHPVDIGLLHLTDLGGFLALCPASPVPALSDLAAACVTDTDAFRAPQTKDEIAKRRANGLTARQEENLRRWGYPYVLEDFRFHITLTGRLNDAKRDVMKTALQPRLALILSEPVLLRDICLYGEPLDGGPFRVIDRIGL